MRSVVVVFPASICAAIPMFRVHSSGNGRSAAFAGESWALPVTTVDGLDVADMTNVVGDLPTRGADRWKLQIERAARLPGFTARSRPSHCAGLIKWRHQRCLQEQISRAGSQM